MFQILKQYSVSIVITMACFIFGMDCTVTENESQTKTRRFLLDQFCGVCTRICPNGYVSSTSGCLLCQCASVTVEQTTQQVVSGGVLLDKPCNPAIRHCRNQCTNGFKLGTNGCQYCACADSAINSTLSPMNTTAAALTTQGQSTVTNLDTTSSTLSTSSTSTTTDTFTTQKLTTTAIFPTTSQTPFMTSNVTSSTTMTNANTSISTTSDKNSAFNDPCIPSQKTCAQGCDGEYIKGPGGCQYCMCLSLVPVELRPTTTTQAPVDELSTTVPHYLDMTDTSEACIMAKVICNGKCHQGFISQPEDCLYCACRNDTLELADDLDHSVRLETPCVNHINTCQLHCTSGYVKGPRDCSFCACAQLTQL
ncbi:uncharacterized protein LOC128222167 isoform X2 [Mya arenaria]|uniref:uncharacterized protein LOC128222167 isoform X2 n=1 Tax=Mya arenaria TaxID=6604 RepID=UPI0022E1C42D|nr:uncharacterized protein LOC128222167 isoform X2 [Mya arenaria]